MNTHPLSTQTQHKGFTVVELLIVIVVIAILVTITFVSYLAIVNQSRAQSVSTDLQTTATELTKYKADNGAYPTPTAFNAIKRANSSGETVYSYGYGIGFQTYCLEASGHDATFHTVGGNSKVNEGSCPPV